MSKIKKNVSHARFPDINLKPSGITGEHFCLRVITGSDSVVVQTLQRPGIGPVVTSEDNLAKHQPSQK